MKYSFVSAIRCEMCGSSDNKVLGIRLNGTQGLRPRRVSGIAVTVKKCDRCELVYADPQPRPQDISDHYGVEAEDYFAEEYLAAAGGAFDCSLVKKLVNFTPGMKALDIGAGLGGTMRSLSEQGWETWGIEPSEQFIEAAWSSGGVPRDRLTLNTVEDADFGEGEFDFVTFGAVLEHLYSPAAAIERAMTWVRPGGVVHVEVPSSRHLVSKIINFYYRLAGVNYVTNLSPMHSPYHLFEFSHRSFEEHGKSRGYEVAHFDYWVGSIFNLPRVAHPPLRWWMARNGTGMQLTLWLRRTG